MKYGSHPKRVKHSPIRATLKLKGLQIYTKCAINNKQTKSMHNIKCPHTVQCTQTSLTCFMEELLFTPFLYISQVYIPKRCMLIQVLPPQMCTSENNSVPHA